MPRDPEGRRGPDDPGFLQCERWVSELLRRQPHLVAEASALPYPDGFEHWIVHDLYDEVDAVTHGALAQLVGRDDPRWFWACGTAWNTPR